MAGTTDFSDVEEQTEADPLDTAILFSPPSAPDIFMVQERKPLFLPPTSRDSGILARFCKLRVLRSRPSISMRR